MGNELWSESASVSAGYGPVHSRFLIRRSIRRALFKVTLAKPGIGLNESEKGSRNTFGCPFRLLVRRYSHKSKNDTGPPFGERPMLPEPCQLSPWNFN